MTEYVEYGNQLATVSKPVRKYRMDGFYILPAPNGLCDGHSMYVWVDAHYVNAHRLPDPFNWYDLPGGVQARWVGISHGREYAVIREVRKTPPAEMAA